ncbi:MAG TPA: ThiF family adenylyltransferase [Clostridia bacterium]|nr:ThiF family adenylyltransferase [Clostridia bacterium]
MSDVLKTKIALIVGCGGLGGFVIEELSRSGIGKLILVDGDTFCESNMNRQLLANFSTLGKNKAETYFEWLKLTSKVDVIAISKFLTAENADIIDDADIVMDCVDKVSTRRFLAEECKRRKKVLIHGAVEGLEGQVMAIYPQDKNFEKLFRALDEVPHKTTSFAVAAVASAQTALAVRVLEDNGKDFRNKILIVDMENISIKTLEL